MTKVLLGTKLAQLLLEHSAKKGAGLRTDQLEFINWKDFLWSVDIKLHLHTQKTVFKYLLPMCVVYSPPPPCDFLSYLCN